MTNVLPGTARHLEAVVVRAQRDGRIPSLVGGLVRNGELVWSASVGNVPGPVLDTQYRIGSITKTMTAILVMQARADGLLTLEDRLDQHVPEAPFGDRTLRSLLTHTSGVPGEPAGDWWERIDGAGFADLAKANTGVAATLPDRKEFLYSNLAYGLLGEVVARVWDRCWFELVQDQILGPLGMTRTTYSPAAPAATGYSVHHLLGTLTEEPDSDTGAMAPAGQLWSTAGDLVKYADFLLNGHPDVLSRALLEEMAVPISSSGDYGVGFRLSAGGSLVGHTGTMPGFMAVVAVSRSRGTGVIVLSNATVGLVPDDISVDLLDTLERHEPTIPRPWRPVTDVPQEVLELVGSWHWGHTAFEMTWNGDRLELREIRRGRDFEEFELVDGVWFDSLGERLEVARRPDGSVSHLVCSTYLFTRSPYDPTTPVPGAQL